MKYCLLIFLGLGLSIAQAQTANTGLDPDFVYDPTAAGTFIYDFQEYELNRVHALSDGKVMVVGSLREVFNRYSGIIRLNNDGSIDQSFTPPNTDDNIFIKGRSFYELPNGQYLVGGIFQPNPFSGFVTGLMRLNNDGSQDTDFGQGIKYPGVQAIAVQPDGKILIGGIGSSLNFGASVARLNPDGTVDQSFNTGSMEWRDVRELVLLPDGRILAAGNFTSWPLANGTHATVGVALLNPDGSLVTSFSHTAQTTFSTIESAYPRVAVQADGKIVVASLSPSSSRIVQVVRYNTDFSLDLGFYQANTPEVSGSNFTGVTILNDGKILLSGAVTNYDGNSKVSGVFRLNADGTVDESFDTNFGFGKSAPVIDCALQSDGKILLFTIGSEYQGVSLGPNSTYPVRQTVIRLEGDVLPLNAGVDVEMTNSQLYPNPASEWIALSGIPLGAELRIFNFLGKQVYENLNASVHHQINLTGFDQGNYIIKINFNGQQSVRKLLVTR